MDAPVTKARFLDTLAQERAAWDALLAEVPTTRLEEPGPAGAWSIKDVIAHVTAYERWALRRLEIGRRGEPYERAPIDAIEDVDARNAAYQAQDAGRALADIRAESDQVYAGLRALVEAAPDSALTDPAYFGLPADIVPWELIAGNGYEHYHEHIPGIRAWLDAVPA